MRYVTLRVFPDDGAAFHPVGKALAAEPSITREAIHRIEELADGSGVMLGEARGDRERYEEILTESEYVEDFAVTGADGRWYSYMQFQMTDLSREMVGQRRETELMMEMPIRIQEDGSGIVTLVGDDGAFGDALPDLPDSISVEVLEIGERHAGMDDLFACLTARQQEILDAAVRLGYYQNPREATHADVAAEVEVSPSTVGEHLRKIESRVFSQFLGDGR
ncbi:helix-turn-helix domain-containing protein [Haloarculaceae archaeon H-GB2-1]|nr:helix-turn-helix domain-containing protein [Haloarculaceae archaeon H-GB1-1]MEA5388596.1 helix-turn-helix domain-containing protein [Haloarculaceae archaeon H-GB11]MEA5406649.1 helix-turn-helix domain-containing protein [Haloarculaceae archaeon H-GB2-1]